MAPRSGGAKSGGALPKLRILCPEKAFFGQKQPRNPVIAAKLRQTVPTLHVRLDFTVSKSPLVPFNSTICPRNGPKRRQKAPKCAQCAPTPRNQARAVSWATWLKIRFRGHLVPPQPPTHLFLDHLGCSNKCFLDILSPWGRVLGHGKSQNALKMGRFKTKNGSKMGQKCVFPKVILDHLG